jgi:hypothetical protein
VAQLVDAVSHGRSPPAWTKMGRDGLSQRRRSLLMSAGARRVREEREKQGGQAQQDGDGDDRLADARERPASAQRPEQGTDSEDDEPSRDPEGPRHRGEDTAQKGGDVRQGVLREGHLSEDDDQDDLGTNETRTPIGDAHRSTSERHGSAQDSPSRYG